MSGAEDEEEVGSGGAIGEEAWERSGAEDKEEVGSGGRRLCVTEPQFLRPGKNPKASLIFGE